jgi:site-specific recombinase XerD
LGLAVVRDLREARRPATAEQIADFETDVLAGFVLARSSAGLSDSTIRGDVGHLEQFRTWFGRPFLTPHVLRHFCASQLVPCQNPSHGV